MPQDYQHPETQPRLLSINEARIALGGIGRTKLWALANAGELNRVSIGARRFITVESIDSFIARHASVSAGAA